MISSLGFVEPYFTMLQNTPSAFPTVRSTLSLRIASADGDSSNMNNVEVLASSSSSRHWL